jgi:glycosyltransferase involved in cell wall biosynthesis
MSSVDVFIPCYRYAHFLVECVNCVLEQELVDVRVLILDDASPDNTPAVSQHLAESDSRVSVHRHKVNLDYP